MVANKGYGSATAQSARAPTFSLRTAAWRSPVPGHVAAGASHEEGGVVRRARGRALIGQRAWRRGRREAVRVAHARSASCSSSAWRSRAASMTKSHMVSSRTLVQTCDPGATPRATAPNGDGWPLPRCASVRHRCRRDTAPTSDARLHRWRAARSRCPSTRQRAVHYAVHLTHVP